MNSDAGPIFVGLPVAATEACLEDLGVVRADGSSDPSVWRAGKPAGTTAIFIVSGCRHAA